MLQSSGNPLLETVTTAGDATVEKDLTVSTMIRRNGLVGTPSYMSPEALLATKPDPGFDVWALSVVLFEAMAGRRPFVGRTLSEVSIAIFDGHVPDIRELRAECGNRVAGFFARTLSAAPAWRPMTARDLHQELFALRAAMP